MALRELRLKKGLTQLACAQFLGVSLRTYVRYELDESKQNALQYKYMLAQLEEYGRIDETHGILTVEAIQEACGEIFSDYNVQYCYLFGSYAKNKATQKSDVDLLIAVETKGVDFFEMVERLREKLGKKVDAIHHTQLNGNGDLVNEILKDGIKIYG